MTRTHTTTTTGNVQWQRRRKMRCTAAFPSIQERGFDFSPALSSLCYATLCPLAVFCCLACVCCCCWFWCLIWRFIVYCLLVAPWSRSVNGQAQTNTNTNCNGAWYLVSFSFLLVVCQLCQLVLLCLHFEEEGSQFFALSWNVLFIQLFIAPLTAMGWWC